MPPSPYDAVIFDLDGTLIDTETAALEAGIKVLADMGYSVDMAFMKTLVGIPEADGGALIQAHLGAPLDLVALDHAWNVEADRRFAEGIALKPGVIDLLDHIDGLGLPKAVCTMSRRARAAANLAAAGLAHRFEIVVSYDCVARPKPAPDPYLLAAERLGMDPARCLAFEDSDTGTRSAMAAGMTTVQVPDLSAPQGVKVHHRATSLLDGARAAGLMA